MGILTRQPGIALFTVVETVGLVVWLALARGTVDVAVPGVAAPAGTVGLGLLFVALFVEHLLTDATVNGLRSDVPVVAALVFSATETALWGVWLAAAEAVGGLVGVAVAGVVLAVLLVPQHTIEDRALRGEGLLSGLFDLGTLGFSVVEAVAASVWLALILRGDLLAAVGVSTTADPALVGAAALAALLFVEHNLGVAFARRPAGSRAPRSSGERATRG